MNKIGLGIVAHAAGAQGLRRVAELEGRQIRYPYINGLPFHVQAFFGDAPGGMAQEAVGVWRPVSGYDLDGAPAPGGPLNLAEHVEKRGVNGMDVAGSEIPEEHFELFLNRS